MINPTLPPNSFFYRVPCIEVKKIFFVALAILFVAGGIALTCTEVIPIHKERWIIGGTLIALSIAPSIAAIALHYCSKTKRAARAREEQAIEIAPPHIVHDAWNMILQHLSWKEKNALLRTNKYFFNCLHAWSQDSEGRLGSIVRNNFKVQKFEKSWSERFNFLLYKLSEVQIVWSETKVYIFEDYGYSTSCAQIRVMDLKDKTKEELIQTAGDITGFNVAGDHLFYTYYSYKHANSRLVKQNVNNGEQQTIRLPYHAAIANSNRIHLLDSYCVIHYFDNIWIHDRNDLSLKKQLNSSDVHYRSWLRQVLLKKLPANLQDDPTVLQIDDLLKFARHKEIVAQNEFLFYPNQLGAFTRLDTASDQYNKFYLEISDGSSNTKIRVFGTAVIVVREKSIDLWNLHQQKVWGSMTFTSKILDLVIYDSSSFIIAFQNGSIEHYKAKSHD